MDILDFIPRCEEKAIRWSLYSEGWTPSAHPPPTPQLLPHAPRQSRVLPLRIVGMAHEITGLKSPAPELVHWPLLTP